ncbi:MAG: hypothetical protein Q9227_004693 [Pyrenula ochraceoflavens]
MKIWLELVPQLLAHLGIEHVALVAHSNGVIYLLNTLYHCRDVLHPKKPFVALLAPWVHPRHSRVKSLQLAQRIPAQAFGIWHLIPEFIVLKANPVIESSGAVITKISNAIPSMSSRSKSHAGQEKKESSSQRDYRLLVNHYEVSSTFQTELINLITRSVFKENTIGANSEALLCLKKGGGQWGVCEEYDTYVQSLIELERRRSNEEGREGQEREGSLQVRAYFAESDTMIGDQGKRYVEECWRNQETGEDFRDVLDFKSTVVDGADHDDVAGSIEVWEEISREVGGSVVDRER